jgi:Ca2+-binding RTX toxin-like protein
MEPTAQDQYMLELINRARLDPQAEANRYSVLGGNLNEGLAAGTITNTAKQALAFNTQLLTAAQSHTQWMFANNQFSHTGANGLGIGARVTATGYNWQSGGTVGENIAFRGNTGTIDITEATRLEHEDLFIDTDIPGRGHRINILNDNFREIGISVGSGLYTLSGTTFNSVLSTQDFGALSGTNPFLTGVVYTDLVNNDNFYTVGEGLGNITVTAVGNAQTFTTQTMSAGGYSLQLAAGTYSVTFTGDFDGNGTQDTTAARSVTIGNRNVKEDFATDTYQPPTPVPIVSIGNVTKAEGNSGTTSFDFNITLNTASTEPIVVSYETIDGSATATSGDYTYTNSAVTFNPGETSKTISIAVIGDTTPEADETFSVNLSDPFNADLGIGEAIATIQNDDVLPLLPGSLAFSYPTYNVNENGIPVVNFYEDGTIVAEVTVTRIGGSDGAVSATILLANGTAGVNDYSNSIPISVSFAAGDSAPKTVTIPINDDTVDEADETINLSLVNPTGGATLGTQQTAVLTIVDNDPSPTISVNNVAKLEGNSGNNNFDFNVTLSAASEQVITVNYATANGTATTINSDYTSATGTITFNPGETSKNVSVAVTGDTFAEDEETFSLNLANPTNATLGNATAIGTIQNDDLPPTPVPGVLAFSNPTYSVNEDGTIVTAVTVTRTGGSDGAVSATINLANGTAGSSDYTNTPIVVNFADGDSASKTVTIPINDDTVDEADETINLSLVNPTGGATLGIQQTAVLTIVDNDPSPTISVNNVAKLEGNSGNNNFDFNVTLSAASEQVITVNYATANGTATTIDSDYTSATGTITFNPGETSKNVSVAVTGDTFAEDEETFSLNLANPTNATLGNSVAIGTIQNDDISPTPLPGVLAFSNPTYSVNEDGTIVTAVTVTRTGGSDGAVSATINLANGTAGSSDYTSLPLVANFAAGDTSPKTFTITVISDTVDEADETINLSLVNPTGGATLGTQQTAVLTIIDDDPSPTVSVNNVAKLEGNSGNTNFDFNVTLNTASEQVITVNYTTANGTAIAGGDYTAATGTITFNPGETSKNVSVNVLGDSFVEGEETFNLNLANPTNATLGTSIGIGTIQNDDLPVALPIVTIASGNNASEPNTAGSFILTRTGNVSQALTVALLPATGTATSGVDYQALPSNVTFAAGSNTANLSVATIDDTLVENTETISIALAAGSGYTIGSTANATIDLLDNDTVTPPTSDFDEPTGLTPTNNNQLTNCNDIYIGDDSDNIVYAAKGDDVILGKGGNDLLLGDNGKDRIYGGTGNDTIYGGNGDDLLAGNDGDDIVGGDDGDDRISGGNGNDSLYGGNGKDCIWGDAGNDFILGDAGDDYLNGGSGDDKLFGGNGNDIIVGGGGNDILTGGKGSDTFEFSGSSFSQLGIDTITDFRRGSDKIALSTSVFGAIGNPGGSLNGSQFATVNTDAMAATSNATIVYNTTNGKLFYNQDGSNVGFGNGGQFAILQERSHLNANDFQVL